MITNLRIRILFFPLLLMLLGCICLLGFFAVTLDAQRAAGKDEAGIPFSRQYTPKEYDSSGQIWAILQDERGILYFGGNTGEVLQYDGVSWRHIPLPKEGCVVRSMAGDANGTIFVGAQNELGYLVPGDLGELRYVSLMEHIPPKDRGFDDVWLTHCTNEGVFFFTSTKLLRLRGNQFKTWDLEATGKIFPLDGFVYVADKRGRLLRLAGDSLEELTVREEFKRGILAMIPLPPSNPSNPSNRDILLATWRGPLKPFNLQSA
jgi:hypothetical protein